MCRSINVGMVALAKLRHSFPILWLNKPWCTWKAIALQLSSQKPMYVKFYPKNQYEWYDIHEAKKKYLGK